MESEKRKKLMARRQKLLDMLNLCQWDLILEKYKEASFKMDEMKKNMDELIVDLVIDALN